MQPLAVYQLELLLYAYFITYLYIISHKVPSLWVTRVAFKTFNKWEVKEKSKYSAAAVQSQRVFLSESNVSINTDQLINCENGSQAGNAFTKSMVMAFSQVSLAAQVLCFRE